MAPRACAGVVLAAGRGTRMRSRTPKVLHPLLGRPIVVHVVDALLAAGAEPVVVVVGHGARKVAATVGDREGRVVFVEQREQLGTGHAAAQARHALAGFSGDILLLPGDTPLVRPETLQRLLEHHRDHQTPLTVLTMTLEEPAHYGRIVRGATGALERIVEARDAGPAVLAIREINAGIYATRAPFLFSALEQLQPDNAQSEYYLTDIVAVARAGGLEPRAWHHPDAGELAGVNDRAELAAARQRLQHRVNQRWMKAGVTLVDPATTTIELGVTLAPDAILEPGVQLLDDCHVGQDARVGTGTIATGTVIGEQAYIGPYCVLDRVALDPGTVLPPFTRLTSNTRGDDHA